MTKKVALQASLQAQLKVSPQIFQQTQIAAMSRIELEHYLWELSEKNPFFRIRPVKSRRTLFPHLEAEYQETLSLPQDTSLVGELQEELLGMPLSATKKWIADILVSSLLPDGRMTVSLESVASYAKVSLEAVQEVFTKLQGLSPSIREFSENPIEGFLGKLFPDSKDFQVAIRYWELLKKRLSQYKREEGALENLRERVKEEVLLVEGKSRRHVLEAMDKALEDFLLAADLFEKTSHHQPVIVKPDVSIKKEKSTLQVEKWGEFLFEVGEKPLKAEVAERELWKQAKDLVSVVQKQQSFFLDLVSFLVQAQEAFFRPEKKVTLLYQKDIAKHFGVHASTVSRTLKEKTFLYQGKIYPLKMLISKPLRIKKGNSISPTILVEQIRDILKYTGDHRVSDEQIRKLLEHRNIYVARKTVNKYRKIAIRDSTA